MPGFLGRKSRTDVPGSTRRGLEKCKHKEALLGSGGKGGGGSKFVQPMRAESSRNRRRKKKTREKGTVRGVFNLIRKGWKEGGIRTHGWFLKRAVSRASTARQGEIISTFQ